jgi:hypothetical protein
MDTTFQVDHSQIANSVRFRFPQLPHDLSAAGLFGVLRWTPEWAVSLVSRGSTVATRVFEPTGDAGWRRGKTSKVEHVLDAGDEVVGRHSGIVIEMPPYGLVFTIRGGKLVRWRIYPDQQSALEDAGLRE